MSKIIDGKKLSLKINLKLAMDIINIIAPNNPIEYLITMIDEIPNFKTTKNKKMLIYFSTHRNRTQALQENQIM